jgi:hypothetical protein
VAYSLELSQKADDSTMTDEGVNVTTGHNDASVTFSNNPGDNTQTKDDDVPDDSTTHYTFPLTLTVADITNQTPLSKASFSFQDTSDDKWLVFDEVSGMVTGKSKTRVATKVTDVDGLLSLKGLAGDVLYRVEQETRDPNYVEENLNITKFMLYIDAETNASDNKLARVGYFFYNPEKATGVEDADTAVNKIYDFDSTDGSALTAPVDAQGSGLELAQPLLSYLVPTVNTPTQTNTDSVLVLNAKTVADMPFTGGSILLYLGITGMVGLAGVVFAVIAVRRRRREAHTTAA